MIKQIINTKKKIGNMEIEDIKPHMHTLIATKVECAKEPNLYFLVQSAKDTWYFTNLFQYRLGSKEYNSLEDAVKCRLYGVDCICFPSPVYAFDSLAECLEFYNN